MVNKKPSIKSDSTSQNKVYASKVGGRYVNPGSGSSQPKPSTSSPAPKSSGGGGGITISSPAPSTAGLNPAQLANQMMATGGTASATYQQLNTGGGSSSGAISRDAPTDTGSTGTVKPTTPASTATDASTKYMAMPTTGAAGPPVQYTPTVLTPSTSAFTAPSIAQVQAKLSSGQLPSMSSTVLLPSGKTTSVGSALASGALKMASATSTVTRPSGTVMELARSPYAQNIIAQQTTSGELQYYRPGERGYEQISVNFPALAQPQAEEFTAKATITPFAVAESAAYQAPEAYTPKTPGEAWNQLGTVQVTGRGTAASTTTIKKKTSAKTPEEAMSELTSVGKISMEAVPTGSYLGTPYEAYPVGVIPRAYFEKQVSEKISTAQQPTGDFSSEFANFTGSPSKVQIKGAHEKILADESYNIKQTGLPKMESLSEFGGYTRAPAQVSSETISQVEPSKLDYTAQTLQMRTGQNIGAKEYEQYVLGQAAEMQKKTVIGALGTAMVIPASGIVTALSVPTTYRYLAAKTALNKAGDSSYAGTIADLKDDYSTSKYLAAQGLTLATGYLGGKLASGATKLIAYPAKSPVGQAVFNFFQAPAANVAVRMAKGTVNTVAGLAQTLAVQQVVSKASKETGELIAGRKSSIPESKLAALEQKYEDMIVSDYTTTGITQNIPGSQFFKSAAGALVPNLMNTEKADIAIRAEIAKLNVSPGEAQAILDDIVARRQINAAARPATYMFPEAFGNVAGGKDIVKLSGYYKAKGIDIGKIEVLTSKEPTESLFFNVVRGGVNKITQGLAPRAVRRVAMAPAYLRAGMAEGGAAVLAKQIALGEDVTLSKTERAKQIGKGMVVGAATAAGFGFVIEGYPTAATIQAGMVGKGGKPSAYLKTSKLGTKGIEGIGNLADLVEAPGDLYTAHFWSGVGPLANVRTFGVATGAAVTSTRADSNLPPSPPPGATLQYTWQGTPVDLQMKLQSQTQAQAKTKAEAQAQAQARTRAEAQTKAETRTKAELQTAAQTRTVVPSLNFDQEFGFQFEPTPTPSETQTKIDEPIKEDIPPEDIDKVPSEDKVPPEDDTRERTDSRSNVPSEALVVDTPPIGLPLPFFRQELDKKRYKTGLGGTQKKGAYQASFDAIVFGIFGQPQEKTVYTGTELRPMLSSEKRSSRGFGIQQQQQPSFGIATKW